MRPDQTWGPLEGTGEPAKALPGPDSGSTMWCRCWSIRLQGFKKLPQTRECLQRTVVFLGSSPFFLHTGDECGLLHLTEKGQRSFPAPYQHLRPHHRLLPGHPPSSSCLANPAQGHPLPSAQQLRWHPAPPASGGGLCPGQFVFWNDAPATPSRTAPTPGTQLEPPSSGPPEHPQPSRTTLYQQRRGSRGELRDSGKLALPGIHRCQAVLSTVPTPSVLGTALHCSGSTLCR